MKGKEILTINIMAIVLFVGISMAQMNGNCNGDCDQDQSQNQDGSCCDCICTGGDGFCEICIQFSCCEILACDDGYCEWCGWDFLADQDQDGSCDPPQDGTGDQNGQGQNKGHNGKAQGDNPQDGTGNQNGQDDE